MTEAQLLSDQGKVFTDFPTEKITIGPTEYDCLAMESREGSDIGLGGFSNEDYHRIALERSLVPAMPQEGQSATFRQKVYSVIRVERDDSGASVIIDIASRPSGQQS